MHRLPKKKSRHTQHLDLRVQELAQLFNSMDPTPFLNKDLDPAAEAFIEAWAMACGPDFRPSIMVHLAQLPAEGNPVALVSDAIHNHFLHKADLARHALKELLRQGRMSALIGLVFVAACLSAAEAIGQGGGGTTHTIARESLTIVGWVAMWRPLQIFLYDWWPIVRRIKVLKALAGAGVQVVKGR
jgi:hypothetical protein